MSTGAYDCAILQELRGIKEELSLINRQNEIVRCRECKHYNAGFECLAEGYGIERDPDWFCADGEREVQE